MESTNIDSNYFSGKQVYYCCQVNELTSVFDVGEVGTPNLARTGNFQFNQQIREISWRFVQFYFLLC